MSDVVKSLYQWRWSGESPGAGHRDYYAVCAHCKKGGPVRAHVEVTERATLMAGWLLSAGRWYCPPCIRAGHVLHLYSDVLDARIDAMGATGGGV